MKNKLCTTTSIIALMFSVSACVGGGGSSDSGLAETPVSTNPPAPPPPPPPPKTPYEIESETSWGYNAIGGKAAYDQGHRGMGTSVAVIDSGVTTSNQPGVDFPRYRHPMSVDIVDGQPQNFETSYGGADDDPHGNAVTSIIMSARDGRGIVGVAPDATLLAVDADQTTGNDGQYLTGDVAAGMVWAADIGVKIINLSLGGGYDPDIDTAIEHITGIGDAILVASAGNSGGSLSYPAKYAGSAKAHGKVIAVGAIDQSGQIADFSSRPETAEQAEFFLVAPGVDIPVTLADGKVYVGSGTSLAAPFVSGALAVLKSAFPFLSNDQLVELVLTTARDLGDTGTDMTYGRGMLDLVSALRKVGPLSLVDSDGNAVDMELSQLNLGAAFGDALFNTLALNQAIALDAFGRGYQAGLTGRIERQALGGFLHQRLAAQESGATTVTTGAFGGGLQLQAASASHDSDHAAYLSSRQQQAQGASLYWQSDETSIGRIEAGYNLAPSQRLLDNDGAGNQFLAAADMISPVAGLTESGRSLKVQGERMGVAFHHSNTKRSGNSLAVQSRAKLSENLSLSHSLMIEEGRTLGSDGSGAFAGFGRGSTSQFLGLHGKGEWQGWQVGGDVTFGMTKLQGGDQQLDNWSTVTSSAFALHASREDVLSENDRFGFIIGQPLRVEGGSVDVTMPTAQLDDGSLTYRSERASLAPSGRELRMEVAYERPLSEQSQVSAFAMLRHQPNHVADADDEALFGLRFHFHW